VNSLRSRLARARADVTARLQDAGIEPWLKPRAGIFLWCRLPGDIDAADLARTALEQGIVLAPGNVFSLSRSAGRSMRVNVAQMGDPKIYDLLRSVTITAPVGEPPA